MRRIIHNKIVSNYKIKKIKKLNKLLLSNLKEKNVNEKNNCN